MLLIFSDALHVYKLFYPVGFWWGITAGVALQVNILIVALCSSAMGWSLLFEAEIFSSFSSVILASFFLTEQKEKEISAFKVVTESCCSYSLETFFGLNF